MKTPIINRDLTKQAPHSPRERFGGFAIMARTVDKCRANMSGTIGEYHYDCPLDNQLFGFKGINGEQFKGAVSSAKNYEDVAAWLESNGTHKTAEEIKKWSDEVEAFDLNAMNKYKPEMRDFFVENCRKLSLNPDTSTLFDLLEADDRATFQPRAQHAQMATH